MFRTFIFDSNNKLLVKGDITIDDGTSNYIVLQSDSSDLNTLKVNGNTKVTSNVYVLNKLGVGTSNPTERVDVIDNLKTSSNLYVMNWIGAGTSNPTERIDIVGNSKVRSNLFVLSNLSISHSNPTEKLDINGNAKISSNVYVMSKVGINTSNPAVGLEVNTTDAVLLSKGTTAQRPSVPVLGHVRYNVDNSQFEGFGAGSAWGSLGGVKSTNQQTYVSAEEYPTSNDDNIRFYNSNIESMRITRQRLVGINTTTPTERVDIVGNTKISSNVYVLSKVGINTSNPAVGLEVNTTDAVLLAKGTTVQRPSVPVLGHVRYNTDNSQFEGFGAGSAWGSLGGVKSTNQQTYVSAEEYPTSNDDNIRFYNSNIESMRITRQRLVGINTTTPTERVDIVGNTKISSNVYVLSKVGINTSNPAVGLEVNTTDAVLLSKGTTVQRPSVPVLGHVRYNTDNSQFEGFGAGSAWGSLGGVKSTNQQTYVSAEEYPTSNDDNIRFYNSNIESMRITRQRLVGINTTTPSERVDIVGNVKISSNEYVMGNVGIGTSNPAFKFDVVGEARVQSNLYVGMDVSSASGTYTSGKIVFGGTIGDTGYANAQIANRRYAATGEASELIIAKFNDADIASGPDRIRLRAATLAFDTYSTAQQLSNNDSDFTASNIRMYITETGNVGIGTTNPLSQLEVIGDAKTTTITTSNISTSNFTSSNVRTCNLNVNTIVASNIVTSNLVIVNSNISTDNITADQTVVTSNIFTSNLYSSSKIGIGTQNPQYQLDVRGDAYVSGSSILSNSLKVAGPMTLCNTINVSGAALLSNTLTTYGVTTLSNSVVISGATTLSNTLNVSGATLLSNALTTYNGPSTFSNNVIVSGQTSLSNTLNVAGAVSLSNTLTVAGSSFLSNDITVIGKTTLCNLTNVYGATTLSNTFTVSGATLLSNTLTTYNGTTTHSNSVIVSGITTLSNNLNVSGPMTLCNSMNVSGASLLSNTLITYGATTLSNTLTVSGATTLSNTLNVSGATILSNALTTYNGTTIHSNAVIVSGITTLSNNLNVSGPMTLCNSMNVSGAALLSNTLVTYGTTTLSNTLTISGATILSNTLNVSGATLLSNALTTYNGTTTHSNAVIVSGITTLSNNLNVSGPMTLCNTINVSGATTLSNTLTTYNGTTTHSNAVIVSGVTTLSNNLNVSGPMTLCNSMNVSGASLLSNTLTTYGATTLSNTLTISGATTLSNNLNVSGATLLSNALTTYNGTTTHSNAVIVSGITTLSNNLNVSGPMTLCNSMNVSGAALLSNTLLTYGATTLSNTLTISGATTLSNTLNVSGVTVLSNALTTYNGTTTHSNNVIIAGTTTLSNELDVSGPMTLCNSMNVSGAALLSNTLITYGATTLSNTLTISGATLLSNALTTYNGITTHSNAVIVSGITTLSNNLNVSGPMTLCNSMNVSGAALLSNTLTTYGATTLSNTLTISGVTTLSNTLNVSGATLLSNELTTYNGTTTHSNAVIVSGITTLSNNLNVSGPMTLCNSMNVSGAALLSNTLLTYGITSLSNNLNVSGSTYLSNTLNVSGATTLSNILLTYGVTTLSNSVIVAGTTLLSNALTTYNGTTTHSNAVIVSGITTLSNNLNVSGPMTLCNSMNVSGAALLSNTVTTYGATTLSNTLTISGATTLSNTLNVSGATTLSNGITVYHGTSTLSNNTYISGNVGIGTSSTNAKLDVRGAIYIDGATGQYPTASYASKKEFIRFGATDGASDYARVYGEGTSDSGKLVIAISDNMDANESVIFRGEKFDGSTRDNMNIRNDGFVGIGTGDAMTEKLQVSSGKIYSDTQHLGTSNDTASIPSFSFKEDSNTGIFHASNDAIGFTTSGSEKVRIDTYGNMGIGTTTPTEKVEIVGTTKITSNLYVMSKLGVGTSNISTACNFLLHVAGDARIDGNLDVTGIFSVTNTDVKVTDQFTISNNGTGPALKVYQMGANPIADFYDDATLALRVADGGSVGIKTGTPTEVLDVVGNTKISANAYVMSQLGVGTSNLFYTLDVAGTQRTTGATMLSNTVLVYGASTFSNNTTTSGVATISNNLNVSGVSRLNGGSKIVIQGGVDGGSNRGIFTWTDIDTNWGIYTGTPGAGKSFSGGSAVAGAGFTAHATRVRVGDATSQGFLFENSSEKLLMSVRGSDGYTYFSSNVGLGTSNWTERLQVAGKIHSDTQVLGTSNDTITRPSFSFKEDSNTGIYHPTGASTIAITTGGSERLRVDNVGNVGIATTGATEKLQVAGKIYSETQILSTTNDSVSSPAFSFKENSNTGIFHAGADTLGVSTGGTERVRVDSVGNVGIGVTPTSTLDVNGRLNLRAGNSGSTFSSNQITFSWNNGSNFQHAMKSRHNSASDNTQNAIDFYLWQTSQLETDIGNKQVLSLTSPGVGIFNSNPAYSLDVSGTINSTGNVTGPTITSLSNLGMFSSNTAISASNTTISLSNYVYETTSANNTNAQATANWASNAGLFGSNTAVWSSNNLLNKAGGSISGNLMISSNLAVMSNVGIGTSNPQVNLHLLNPNGGDMIILESTSSNSRSTVKFLTASNTGWELGTRGTNGTPNSAFYIYNNSVGGSNISQYRMIIDETGNVGVGTVTPAYKLDVSGTINSTGYITGPTITSLSNLGIFGSNTAISASNTTISLSNYTYGTNTTNITNAQTTANWASNAGLFGSNTAVWSSNNLLNRNGDTVLNFFEVSSNTGIARIGSSSTGGAFFSFGQGANMYMAESNWPHYGVGNSANGKVNLQGYYGVSIGEHGSTTMVINQGQVGIGVATSTEKLHVASGKIYSDTQLLGTSNDTASLPSFSFKEDSNTGIFHASNDAIGFSTNGTEKMRINTSGFVGIGTATPVSQLDVRGVISTYIAGGQTSTYTPYASFCNNATTGNLYFRNSNLGIDVTNNANNLATNKGHLIINEYADETCGFVGIKATYPTEKLHVAGKMYSDTQLLGNSNDSASIPSFSFKEDSNTGIFHASNDAIGFSTNGTEKMRIDTSGKIGIGNSNPTTLLDVSGTINSTGIITGPTITSLSNLGMFSSNTAISASNTTISLSNYTYGTNTTNITNAQTTANWASNAGLFGSNTAVSASNTTISLSNYTYGTNTTNITNAQTTANWASNAGLFGSNTAVSASNTTISLSNYTYGTNTTNITNAQTTANWASNAGLFGSNTSVSASNTTISLSNYTYGTNTTNITNAQTTANWASNAGLFGSNTAVASSNVSIWTSNQLSNYTLSSTFTLYSNALASNFVGSVGSFSNLVRIAVPPAGKSNLLEFHEGYSFDANSINFAVQGDFAGTGATGNKLNIVSWLGCNVLTMRADGNVGVLNSNPTFSLDVNGTINSTAALSGPTITSLSNLGMFGSNTAVSASNTTISLSNYVYGTNTTNITNAQTTANWASNAGLFGSNTAVSSSNTTISLSNYTYGTNTTNITNAQTTANWASNAGLFGSNYAVWSSNNLVKKTGDTMTSTLTMNGITSISVNFSNNRGASAAIGMAYSAIDYSTDANSNDLIIRNTSQIGRIYLQNGATSSALCVNSNNYIGINTATPTYNLDVNGTARVSSGIAIPLSNVIEFGQGVAGKEANAGKIGYTLYSTGLDIIGAGAAANTRLIRLWDYVAIGGSPSTTYALNVYGTVNATTYTGTTITSLSNLGLFGSNTAVSASNITIALSNYTYGTNTTNITNAQTTANWASNAGLFGSNTAVSASNTTIALSNYTYGTNTTNITNAQTTANWASNAGLFGSNTAVSTSNTTIALSNYTYGTNTTNITNAQTTANWASNAGLFGSNTAVSASNKTISLSNYTYGTNTTNISWASNAGLFGSNTAVSASNTTISLSNYVYGTNTTNITNAQTTANWASNAGLFGSNTAVSASNTTISLSNYTYGTNTTNITNAQTTADWASNAGLFGSNYAVWSSNNLVKKTGDTMTSTLTMNGTTSISVSFSNNKGADAAIGLAYLAGQYGGDANSNDLVIRNTPTIGRIFLQNGGSASALCVNSNNNIGIGTATPAYKLEVSGTSRFSSLLSAHSAHLNASTSVSSQGAWFAWNRDGGGGHNWYINNRGGGGGGHIFGGATSSDVFTETMRITTTGYMGIGSTAPSEKLQVVSGKIYSDTQVLGTSNDSVTIPSFSFKEDSNTGIFHASNGAIGFATNGSEKMRIDTNGYVGIGKSNPTYPLDVSGDINFTGTFRQNGTPYIGSQWTKNSTTVFLLNSNVAIGTSYALAKLHLYDVSAVSTLLESTSAKTHIHSHNDTKSYFQTSNDLFFGQIGTITNPRMYLTSGGSLGVNTMTPTERLHVSSGKIYSDTQVLGSSNDSVTIPSFSFKEDSNTGIFHASNDAIGFTTNGSEKMRINTSGYVGIGTATPSNLLDVNGSFALGSAGFRVKSFIGNLSINVSGIVKYAFSNVQLGAKMLLATHRPSPGQEFTVYEEYDVAWTGVSTIAPTILNVKRNKQYNTSFRVNSRWLFDSTTNTLTLEAQRSVVGFSIGINLLIKGLFTADPVISTDASTASGTVLVPTCLQEEDGDISMASNLNVGSNIVANGNLTMNNRLVVSTLKINRKTGIDVNVTSTSVRGFSNVSTGIILDVGSNAPASGQSMRVTWSNNTELMRVTGDGNVGIGTSSPEYKLDVNGVARVANGILMNQNDDTYIGINAAGYAPSLGIVKKSGYSPTFAFTSNAGSLNTANAMYFGMLSGSNLAAVSACNLTTYMTLNNAGNLGIGTTNPSYTLDVLGNIAASNFIIRNGVASTGDVVFFNRKFSTVIGNSFMRCDEGGGLNLNCLSNNSIQFRVQDVAKMIMDSNGNVGIGTASPAYKLHVVGDIYASGNITAYSDMRAKSNLEVIQSSIDKVSQLTGYTYEMIDNPDLTTKITPRFTGIIAQDIEKVLPEAVHKDKEGKYSVAYGNLAGLFVESIKELTNENKELKNKVMTLEERIVKLEHLLLGT